jgi:hypothetical protein
MKEPNPVSPETISSVIARLREEVDEMRALAASLTHPPSVADLMATAKALRRDIAALERIADSYRAGSKPRRGNRERSNAT